MNLFDISFLFSELEIRKTKDPVDYYLDYLNLFMPKLKESIMFLNNFYCGNDLIGSVNNIKMFNFIAFYSFQN